MLAPSISEHVGPSHIGTGHRITNTKRFTGRSGQTELLSITSEPWRHDYMLEEIALELKTRTIHGEKQWKRRMRMMGRSTQR